MALKALHSVDPFGAIEEIEAVELRRLSGELLRQQRELTEQLRQREQSCTELLRRLECLRWAGYYL